MSGGIKPSEEFLEFLERYSHDGETLEETLHRLAGVSDPEADDVRDPLRNGDAGRLRAADD